MFSSLSLSPISKKKMHVLIYAFIFQVAFQSSASEMIEVQLEVGTVMAWVPTGGPCVPVTTEH